MATASMFKNFSVPVEKKSLILISKDIESDKYRPQVEQIRTLLAAGKTTEAQDLKKQLPAFTPSAVFSTKRLMEHLEMYSGFVHLDFDKLTEEQMTKARKVIASIPFTFLCFTSPSGNGLKVFIEVTSGVEDHAIAYQQVQQFYEAATGLKADPSCKDITRLCFVSWDPQLFKNINNKKFKVATASIPVAPESLPQKTVETDTEPEDLDAAFIFNQQVQFTNQKTQYSDGNRNNYVYTLASNCNRAGLQESITCSLITDHFDLDHREVQAAVKSAYTHHASEFAKFAKSAKLQTEKPVADHSKVLHPADDEETQEDYLKTTPTIPDAVYDALPDVLRIGAQAFTEERRRDVFFTGAIAILSGCLPNVTGVYFQERVYPHLYTFIIAPAASGKGVLKNAIRLAEKYHEQILANSKEVRRRYDDEMLQFKEILRGKKKTDPTPEKPEEPSFKVLFIPADSSYSRMVDHLEKNNGEGIICETEADTMSGTKKQDWGDYSPILRAAFHHEKIAMSRKTDNQYTQITEPRLAVTLSGTPAQAPRLISSAEDGLFTRFLFYAFKTDIQWQDPSPRNRSVIFNDHFNALSDQVLRIINFLQQTQTEVLLRDDHWDSLNEAFAAMLSDVTIFTSEEASGIVYRLGLIMFRLCMIFTALRKVENAELSTTIYCSDEDFASALAICQTYLQHSILMFNNLPKQNDSFNFLRGENKRKFFDSLPSEFTRKEAVALAASFKLCPRLVATILKASLGRTLVKEKAGLYRKL